LTPTKSLHNAEKRREEEVTVKHANHCAGLAHTSTVTWGHGLVCLCDTSTVNTCNFLAEAWTQINHTWPMTRRSSQAKPCLWPESMHCKTQDLAHKTLIVWDPLTPYMFQLSKLNFGPIPAVLELTRNHDSSSQQGFDRAVDLFRNKSAARPPPCCEL